MTVLLVSERPARLLESGTKAALLTNNGLAPIYIDHVQSVSPTAYALRLDPGNNLQWSAGEPFCACTDKGVTSSLGVLLTDGVSLGLAPAQNTPSSGGPVTLCADLAQQGASATAQFSPLMAVGSFQSLVLVSSTVSSSVYQVLVRYYMEPTSTSPVYQDTFICGNVFTGANPDGVTFRSNVRGPYCQVVLVPTGGAGVTSSLRIYGSYNVFPRVAMRNNGANGFLNSRTMGTNPVATPVAFTIVDNLFEFSGSYMFQYRGATLLTNIRLVGASTGNIYYSAAAVPAGQWVTVTDLIAPLERMDLWANTAGGVSTFAWQLVFDDDSS